MTQHDRVTARRTPTRVTPTPRRAPPAGGGNWAVVLAGGEGSRLRALTTTASGIAVPKQFCSLRGGASLLEEALQRAAAIAPTERISTVVAVHHAAWWCRPLAGLAPANVFVQPQNRGTALGILLAVLNIFERDPHARVVILPADHHVGDEAVFARALAQAVAAVRVRPADILLLGITPEEADPELGYIVPAEKVGDGSAPVAWFVEKPTVRDAQALIERGALWNAFIIAARATALLEMFDRYDPGLLRRMRFAVRRANACADSSTPLTDLYLRERSVDFSHDIAQRYGAVFRVLRVPACAWTDLGTVQRVTKTLLGAPRPATWQAGTAGGFLNLEQQHRAGRAMPAAGVMSGGQA
ncbi:MAG: sugar phosphate nucleotidyltransferase [Gammaproteobacteria bacterium]